MDQYRWTFPEFHQSHNFVCIYSWEILYDVNDELVKNFKFQFKWVTEHMYVLMPMIQKNQYKNKSLAVLECLEGHYQQIRTVQEQMRTGIYWEIHPVSKKEKKIKNKTKTPPGNFPKRNCKQEAKPSQSSWGRCKDWVKKRNCWVTLRRYKLSIICQRSWF